MKKIYKLVFCLCLLTLLTAGCKAEDNIEYTFSSEEVEQIVVHTDGQNIELVPSEEDDVKISMATKDAWQAKLEDGSLSVDIPSPSGILNLKTQTLHVELPIKVYRTINLIATSGTIKVDDIQTTELSAETDSGNISIKAMEGDVAAKTNSGNIKSSLSISSAIVPEDAGYALNGTIGTGNEESSNMKFNSVSGTISID
ncbi:DUF4097 family beta strand repeat-containing protein [Desulfosporosinus fructosivorans]